MSALETIVRPFADVDVTPQGFTPPGTVGVPPVRVSVGLKGGSKTFSTSASSGFSTYMGSTHTESSPSSPALQKSLASPATTG
jgi:hypothetical protein